MNNIPKYLAILSCNKETYASRVFDSKEELEAYFSNSQLMIDGEKIVAFVKVDPLNKEVTYIESVRKRGWYRVEYQALLGEKKSPIAAGITTAMFWSSGKSNDWYSSTWRNVDNLEDTKEGEYSSAFAPVMDALAGAGTRRLKDSVKILRETWICE